ncbi:peptidoglycan editing factor PgeF [Lachnospiraceae bacterium NSJ-46]|uniref:Purine nucleoside phosphorylase n=1 Tax=Jingyaoa shaoxingensis TaxID=2763671 RepID=A0ABR7N7G2_9FIRM|nr:peptidoglycan editing factor PgeF [Jingyaoa shaoxingensis]MBC8572340.1 peptidoglycan editing factor PgeF [Jingyaoa shaoxingensis]
MDHNHKITIKRSGSKPVVRIQEKDGVYWLTYPRLEAEKEFLHGFSTRLGGVSKEHLYSMNLSFARGDRKENVRENFQRIAHAVGFSEEKMVFTHQTHTTNVRKVTEEDWGKGFSRERDYSDVDGLITNVSQTVLTTFYADCVPIYLVDPVKKAIGLCHSGWRGTVGRISQVTIARMQEEYGSDPKDILAAVGPSICQNCYEVSGDVIEQFQDSFREKYWKELFYQKENGKYQLNLWKANEIILEEAGITKEHISVTDICTCCNPQLLYSHRASKGQRGNLAAFLMIR